jgi:two-component system chemotaxis response regulator CheY
MTDAAMKILVVDDFSTMRRIVKNCLKQLGYTNIEEAENGDQAFSRMQSGDIQFIVSDWNMPVMDGLALLAKVRGDDALKDTPFLMVTAEAEQDKVVAAIKAGVNNYIVKPFTPETMREKIDKIFQKG